MDPIHRLQGLKTRGEAERGRKGETKRKRGERTEIEIKVSVLLELRE